MTATTISAPTRRFQPGVALAALLFGLLCAVALWPGMFTAASPIDGDPLRALQPPSGEHLLGTDQLGRDLWARVLHGARYSLLTGLAATALAVLGGAVLGLLSALAALAGSAPSKAARLGRLTDETLMRAVDVMLALPGILIALLVVAVLGPGPISVLMAIAIAEIPGYARLVRGQVLVVGRAEYVTAAVALGLRRSSLVLRHILPNSLGPVLVLATLGTGTAILIGAALSFLGLGPRDPIPEWGSMLAASRDFLGLAWWLAFFPGAAITLTVVAVNVVGRFLRVRFEGRS